MIVTSPNTLRDLTRNNPAQLKLGVTSTMILWGMKVTQFASQPENYPMSSVSNFRKRTLSVEFLPKASKRLNNLNDLSNIFILLDWLEITNVDKSDLFFTIRFSICSFCL